jgi:hypothetical protein
MAKYVIVRMKSLFTSIIKSSSTAFFFISQKPNVQTNEKREEFMKSAKINYKWLESFIWISIVTSIVEEYIQSEHFFRQYITLHASSLSMLVLFVKYQCYFFICMNTFLALILLEKYETSYTFVYGYLKSFDKKKQKSTNLSNSLAMKFNTKIHQINTTALYKFLMYVFSLFSIGFIIPWTPVFILTMFFILRLFQFILESYKNTLKNFI